MLTVPHLTDVAQAYIPCHSELFAYNEAFMQRFIDPSMHHNTQKERPTLLAAVQEIAEQVYHLQLFTPAFCQCLIEEAEHHGEWETNLEKTVESHPLFPDDARIVREQGVGLNGFLQVGFPLAVMFRFFDQTLAKRW